ncbi:hypothetical protein FVE85_5377 [Porphyridium purpureum]|uniref:Secreted protein n=1 Tax=Porphyridium purpureum TaxID=35688 RepID=A0A5J4Z3N5_PORPP|nr:hypothetical protein FVE85_5377 [Porphyridium purpureum]|eukprot:POR6090..scf295_1
MPTRGRATFPSSWAALLMTGRFFCSRARFAQGSDCDTSMTSHGIDFCCGQSMGLCCIWGRRRPNDIDLSRYFSVRRTCEESLQSINNEENSTKALRNERDACTRAIMFTRGDDTDTSDTKDDWVGVSEAVRRIGPPSSAKLPRCCQNEASGKLGFAFMEPWPEKNDLATFQEAAPVLVTWISVRVVSISWGFSKMIQYALERRHLLITRSSLVWFW